MEGPGPGPGPGQGQGPGPGEKPGKAAECLRELTLIMDGQHALLERQKARIAELELQVTEMRSRNARAHEEYERHLRTCTLQHQHHNNNLSSVSALSSIQEKPEHGASTRMIRRHASLPVETSSSIVSSSCRRRFPCRQWKSASFRSVDTLHQFCCPAPLYVKQLAAPAPLRECRDDLHRFCCLTSGCSSPSR